MSLINDMLRDLSRRQPLHGQALRVGNAMNARDVRQKPDTRLGAVLLLVLVVGLLSAFLYQWYREQSRAIELSQTLVVPAPAAPVPVTTPAVTTAVEPAPVPLAMDIVREQSSESGFTLRISVPRAVEYQVRDRSTFGLVLHLAEVQDFRHDDLLGGMSVLPMAGGANLEFELNQPVDFIVREDSSTEGFDLLVTASYRPPASSNAPQSPVVASDAQPAPVPGTAEPRRDAEPVDTTGTTATNTTNNNAAVPSVTAPATTGERAGSAPVRVARELSFEQRDLNTSQQALAMLQGGRLFEAYQLLLTFIGENPAAHQSRETLVTLLFAQQEYIQARQLVDEGLALVPNYAPYKKIKARLLLQAGDQAQALELLRSVPPLLADDPEYHELLASLYQQSNDHTGAIAAYQALLRYNSQIGRWWVGLGISLEAQGMPQDAVSSYQAALQAGNLETGLRQYSQNRIANIGAAQ